MGDSVTISVKSILLAAVVLLGLVAAYLVGAAGGDGPVTAANAAAEPKAAARTVTMGGTGEATGVPDQLTFGVTVTVTETEVSASMDRASATMRRILGALKKQGVTAKDVQSTGLNIEADYRYVKGQPPEISGYNVTQKARVKVRELGSAGKAITAAVDAGGNTIRVNAIRLEMSDPESVISEARDAAIKEAKDKAEQYAAATGQTLGDVVTLKEVSASRPEAAYTSLSQTLDMAAARTMPIRAGEEELKVSVSVVWSFA